MKQWIVALGLLSVVSNPVRAQAADRAPPDTIPTEATRPAQQDEAAKTNQPLVEEIVVFGRGERLIGRAASASEGTVGGDDLLVRPMLKVAELLEAVPGLIAAQHSGSGKANQYFLRGFNLDHGTDFTTYIDDVPMNLRTHGHGQGYLDLNGLIAETVERIDFRKGTYRADTGDFSPAGASFMSTIDRFAAPFIAAEAGQYGWQRWAGGGTSDILDGALTYVAQYQGYNGPWELPENLRHESLWTKYLTQTSLGALQVSLSGYHATWHPTEQIPERVVGTSVCEDEFCTLDPTASGETLRWIATARLSGEDWRATVYGQSYDWHMLSNSTYDAQINQLDRRWIAGGRYERTWRFGGLFNLTAGTELRYDDIGNVGLQSTDRARFVAWISRHAVKESSGSVYTEATWNPIRPLRLTGGLRADRFEFDVRAREALPDVYSGSATDSAVSPKLGAAYELGTNVEVYANWGRGFHSNDARGVINPVLTIAGLSPSDGKEAGVRLEVGGLKLTATYWWLDLDSELKFVGDSNSVEPGPATKRRGYELTGFWRPRAWMAVDAVWTGSRGQYVGNPDGDHIPGAVENVGEIGVAATAATWELSARLRYLGDYPLIEDNSQRADTETHLSLRAAWKPGRWNIYGEVLNVFDEHGKDIVYWYGTNVAGIDAPPEPTDPDATRVEGRVSRAEEPRTLRIGIKYQFQ